MTEISAKEFGKLQSDVEYLKNTSDNHTRILEKMDTKLDGLVTHEQLNKTLEPLQAQVIDHETRLAALEQRNTLSDSSVWNKIGIAFEGNFVKFLGVAVFGFALFVGYLFIRQEIIRSLPIEFRESVQIERQK